MAVSVGRLRPCPLLGHRFVALVHNTVRGAAGAALVVAELAVADDRVRLVDAGERPGLSYARNVGASHARGEWIAFCDDDDLVAPGWIEAMVTALREHPFVASRMEYAFLNSPSTMSGRSQFQRDRLQEMFGYPIVNGALGIRRELWLQVGGNDETMTGTGEDIDFSIRVQRETGIRPVLATDAEYHYRQRDGARAAFRQARRYGGAHVELYSKYGRQRTDRRAELRRARHDWWWIVSRMPFAWRSARRTIWARKVGFRLGRLTASVQLLCWYP